MPLPNLNEWDNLSLSECEEVIPAILERIPSSFQYVKLETQTLGNWSHRVAFFQWNSPSASPSEILFAFLPGCSMTLGYDKNEPFRPSSRQLKSWHEQTIHLGFTSLPLEDFLEKVLLPIRSVSLQPFLLQVVATDPEKPPILREGRMKRQDLIDRTEVLRALENEGFRLPSSDEWEYACGAGADTLFRWGNDTPPHPPFRPHQAASHREEWDLHLKQNAFGLFMGNDPYKWEFCLELELMRGGDGGSALSAGVGTFAQWLTFATPYARKLEPWRVNEGSVHGAYFRRAYTVE